MTWGGFLSWEGLTPSNDASGVQPFLTPAYGRQALTLILQQEKPQTLHLPFYLCDSVAEAAHFTNTPIQWYSIHPDLSPKLPVIGEKDMVVVVNYFGIVPGKTLQDMAKTYGPKLILDLTHDWFGKPPENVWAFSSTRKFFGVPDGSRVWRPKGKTLAPDAPYNQPEYRHLIERIQGNPDEAYRIYSSSEAAITCEIRRQSHLTTGILQGLDLIHIANKRSENFRILASTLQAYNQLNVQETLDSIPFHYPFLPKTPIAHQSLHERKIFAPRLWAEVLTRHPEGFEWEKHLAANLLPLPVDQRYDANDMEEMLSVLQHLMK